MSNVVEHFMKLLIETGITRLASLAHSGCRRSATNAGKRGWGTPGQARALRALAPGEEGLI